MKYKEGDVFINPHTDILVTIDSIMFDEYHVSWSTEQGNVMHQDYDESSWRDVINEGHIELHHSPVVIELPEELFKI